MHPALGRFANKLVQLPKSFLALILTALVGMGTVAAVSSLGSVGIALVFTIVGIVVVMLVLSELAPTFFDGLGSLIENFTTVELGTSNAANIAESIINVLAILVAIAGAFVLVAFALKAFKARN